MKYYVLIFFAYVFLTLTVLLDGVKGQDQPSIELPVELVGFPVIIAAVRLSNFVKKLAYSLNPRTYTGRRRRSITYDDMIDVGEAEKQLISEFGDKMCIYPKVCLYYAEKSKKTNSRNYNIDWEDILSHYKSPSETHKEFYLLSTFLGDIIGSTKFCNQLAKRGRVCSNSE